MKHEKYGPVTFIFAYQRLYSELKHFSSAQTFWSILVSGKFVNILIHV